MKTTASAAVEAGSIYEQGLRYIEAGLYITTASEKTKRPCWGKADSPNKKGGHLSATIKPGEWEKLCERGDAIIVNLEASALICFDIDFRDGADEANAKLMAWYEEHLKADVDAGVARVHRSQNGGWHVFYKYDEDAPSPPGAIFPELQIKYRGYVLLPVEGGKYAVEAAAPWADLEYPPEDALIVREAKTGVSQIGGIMSRADAIEVLQLDAEGQRHDAINALAVYVVRADPEMGLKEAVAAVAELVDEHMPAGDRKKDLMDVRFEPDSEIVRSVRPLMKGGRLRSKAVGDVGTDRLANVLSIATGKPVSDVTTIDFVADEAVIAARRKEEHEKKLEDAIEDDYVVIDLSKLRGKVLPKTVWQIGDVLPVGTLWGIAGPTGAGKTHFGTALSTSLSVGQTEAIGMPPAPVAVNVLYLANEMWADDMAARLQATMERLGIDTYGKIVVRGQKSGPLRMNDPAVEELLQVVDRHEIGMVIVDHFASAHEGKENVSDEVAVTMQCMKSILQTNAKITVGFMHHVPKQDSYEDLRGSIAAFRGSGGIGDWLDFGWTIMPYLPGDAVGSKAESKRRRQHIADAQAAKECPKYVVLDVAKPRKGTGHAPIWYELSGVELPNGDVEAGLRPVSRDEADRVMRAAATNGDSARMVSALLEPLRKIGEHFGWEEGVHTLSAPEAANVLGHVVKKGEWSKGALKDFLTDVGDAKWHAVDGFELRILQSRKPKQVEIKPVAEVSK